MFEWREERTNQVITMNIEKRDPWLGAHNEKCRHKCHIFKNAETKEEKKVHPEQSQNIRTKITFPFKAPTRNTCMHACVCKVKH